MRTLLAIALVLLCAPVARAAPELGLQDDRLFLGAPVTGQSVAVTPEAGVALARRLGVRTLRMNVRWAGVAQAPGAYDLFAYDAAIARARAAGLRVQLSLTGPAPAFATSDHRVGNTRPDPAAYGRFAAAVARHYRGQVARYAIWNEPNWHGYLVPGRRAGTIYRGLFRAGRAAIRRVDPGRPVLFGELAPMGRPEAAISPLRFLRQATCSTRSWRAAHRCRGLRADGVALHPYTLRWRPGFPGPGPDDVTTGSLGRLEDALRLLARRGALATRAGAPPRLYLTEWGFHARSRSIPEPERSEYLRAGLAIVGADPWVRQIVWYQLVGSPDGPRPGWDTGLVGADGSLRPAFSALAGWARR